MNKEILDLLSKLSKDILINCAKKFMSKHENRSERVCVKVANLRKLYGSEFTLENWLKDPNNIYCGRHGRIFIDKIIFHYSGSKWANPFTLKQHSLDECIKLYRDYITKKIIDNPEYYDLDELRGKHLGCWCNPKEKCHVDVLLSLIH